MATFTLNRTSGQGTPSTWRGLTLREVGQMVYFCAVDNLQYTPRQAARCGVDFERMIARGPERTTYRLEDYSFEAVAE